MIIAFNVIIDAIIQSGFFGGFKVVPKIKYNRGMERVKAKLLLDDKKQAERRTRNILANSGEIMESGEIRDIKNLYVMDYDGNLIRVADLDTNPDKQSERYAVKAQADHGEVIDGELVPTIEKQFGSCRVWLAEDGLHARMYFANEDRLADHAWAISEDASYSTGIDWFPDGYYGAGYEIDEPIGILREISMVLTGNDPRAKTIDTKPTEAEAHRSADADGETNINNNGDNQMEIKPDETPAVENEEIVKEEVVETAETETKTEEVAVEETKEEEKVEETKDSKHMPVVVVRDRVAKQEVAGTSAKAYLSTDKAVAAWGQALLDSKGDAKAWRDNFRAIAKKDGIDFGADVTLAPEAVINAIATQLEDTDTLFAHVNKTGLAFEVAAIPTAEGGATGHVRGKNKVEEEITGITRVFTPADLYKLMKLDHSMVKLNGGIGSSAIVKYVLNEMPRKLIESIDKAILVGGIADDNGATFTALNAIKADIANAGMPTAVEYTAATGDNLRATISKAANRVTSSATRILISTQDFLTDLENTTTEGGQLLFPNGISKSDPRINGISQIITPLWLTATDLGDYKAIIADLNAYHTVGDSTPESFTDYDIDVNKYVWEAVACIGGGLASKAAAVGIKTA